MPALIPHIFKHKRPQEVIYLLKYSDLEACFADRISEDLHLNVTFWFMNRYLQNQHKSNGRYYLMTCTYSPDLAALLGHVINLGEGGLVIDCTVYGTPKIILEETSLTRKFLRETFIDQLNKLTPKGLTAQSWQLSLNFLPKSLKLECETWTSQGKQLRINAPGKIVLIPIEKEKDLENDPTI